MQNAIKTGLATMGLILTVGLVAACNADRPYDKPDTVKVTGTAEREVMPDYFQVHLLLEERGPDGTTLADPLEEKLESLLSLARDHGLDDDDIRAWEIQLQQERHWDREEQRHMPGDMRMSRKVRLNADAEKDMGALLGAILRSGTAQIERIESRLRDTKAIEGELLEEAIVNARQRASHIAQGDGRSLGRLLQSEHASQAGRLSVTGSRMEQADTAIHFEPEPIEVNAHVQATFMLE